MTPSTRTADVGGRLRYLFVLSRPRFWLYLAGPVAIGLVFGADAPATLLTPAAIGLIAYFLVPANVLIYGVNDVFDAEIDAANPKKGARPRGEISPEAGVEESRSAEAEPVGSGTAEAGSKEGRSTEAEPKEAHWRGDPTVAATIGLSGMLGVGTFLLTPSVAWPYLAGFFVLGVGYSAPPLRFKTTPFLDSIANGLYLLPGAAAYAAVSGTHPPMLALLGAWLWTMAMHTFSAIPDIGPDRAAGIETTATLLGERRTYVYCLVCWTGAAVAFAALDVRSVAAFGVYPAFVAWVATADVAVERAYWWFPAVNTVVGAALTMAGLWRLVPLPEVLG